MLPSQKSILWENQIGKIESWASRRNQATNEIDTYHRAKKALGTRTMRQFFNNQRDCIQHKLPVILNLQRYLCSTNVFSSKFITQILVINTSNPYIPVAAQTEISTRKTIKSTTRKENKN